nr:hypothetical protein [Priestia aryabhattai]MDH3132577.1 hypothetical protein [Priestia aryabhattai]
MSTLSTNSEPVLKSKKKKRIYLLHAASIYRIGLWTANHSRNWRSYLR